MKYPTALATVLLSTASFAWAGSLNRDAIPASAQWMLHIDLEAMNGSEIGACLIEGLRSQEDNPLNAVEAETGIKLLEDMYSFTAYGFGEPPAKGVSVEVTDEDLSVGAIARPGENAVFLAVTNDAVDELIKQLSADEENYSKTDLAGHTVHSWSSPEGDEQWHLYQKEMKGGTRRAVLVCDNIDALAEAIKVLAGDAPSLADNKDASETATPRSGSIIFAVASDIGEMADHEGASALLQQTDKIALDLSEEAGLVNLTLSVRAKSAEAATMITQILQGAIAMGTLALDPNAEETASIRALTQSLKFSSDDRRMSLEIEQPAEVFCGLLEMLEDGTELDLNIDYREIGYEPKQRPTHRPIGAQ